MTRSSRKTRDASIDGDLVIPGSLCSFRTSIHTVHRYGTDGHRRYRLTIHHTSCYLRLRSYSLALLFSFLLHPPGERDLLFILLSSFSLPPPSLLPLLLLLLPPLLSSILRGESRVWSNRPRAAGCSYYSRLRLARCSSSPVESCPSAFASTPSPIRRLLAQTANFPP